MRNVWRVPMKRVLELGKYRLTDVLWWTRQEEVFEEIASIMEIPKADTSTPGWFPLRTKASKNILEKMTNDERRELEDVAEKLKSEGLPIDLQRKYVPYIAVRCRNAETPKLTFLRVLGLPKKNGIPDYRQVRKRITWKWG